MKFLVLALCVCYVSAASYGAYKPWQGQQQVAKAVAQVAYKPAVTVEYQAPVVPVKSIPVQATKTSYNGKGIEKDAGIVRAESVINDDGYNYFYETANGIAAQSSGIVKKVDDQEVIVAQGSYQYIDPEGRTVKFSYIADENGYQPQSEFLPVGPPIPEAIARSLEYIRTHPSKSENY